MARKRGADPRDDREVATQARTEVRRPNLYKVLLHNDDYTTMEFVVMVLTTVFHHGESEAVRIMLQVHRKGVGVAGVYPYDIAEARAARATRMARANEFPLRLTLERDG